MADDGGDEWPPLTRRRFLGATAALGGAAYLPPPARAIAAGTPAIGGDAAVRVAFRPRAGSSAVEDVARFLLRRALVLSPPVIVALAHGGGPGLERFAALRARAASQIRARGLLIHRTVDLGESEATRAIMHTESQGAGIDGWHFRLPGTVSSLLVRRFGTALENAARMARHVVWVELPASSSPWLPLLARAAASNPWLRFVLIASPDLLAGAELLLAQPNVLVLFESRQLLRARGRRVLEIVGGERMLWGVGDLAASALFLEPLTLAVRLGRRCCDAVLSSGAAEAYGLEPHHYR